MVVVRLAAQFTVSDTAGDRKMMGMKMMVVTMMMEMVMVVIEVMVLRSVSVCVPSSGSRIPARASGGGGECRSTKRAE